MTPRDFFFGMAAGSHPRLDTYSFESCTYFIPGVISQLLFEPAKQDHISLRSADYSLPGMGIASKASAIA